EHRAASGRRSARVARRAADEARRDRRSADPGQPEATDGRALQRAALHLDVPSLLPRVRLARGHEGGRTRVRGGASRLFARGNSGVRRRRKRHRAGRLGRLRRRGRECTRPREGARGFRLSFGGRGGRRPGAGGVPRLPRMIDLRAARNDPEAFRAALRRRGADNAFDELLAADGRWRALVPQVDELRARQKVDGKPTPEQIEELKGVKDRLRALEEELAAAEAEREAALAKVPNPPHESAADGMTEDEAVEIKRWGEPPQLEHPREHTELGRFELERAAKISGARFGFIAGDTALLALALYRHALD